MKLRGGKRASIHIPERHVKLWREIENKSGFVSLALDDAVGIMAWAILRKEQPEKYNRPIDKKDPKDVLPKFNKTYPLDELTAKRTGKECPKNSPKPPELW